jgi:hypothetical protein
MDTTTTLFAVIGISAMAFMIVGMLISQSRYKALEAKNNQIRMLNLQQRRLNNLLRSLPSSYLSNELRDFLYQAIQQNLKSQIQLLPEKSTLLKDDYQHISEERERVRQNPPTVTKELLTADQASVYRGLLKSLYEFIRRNYETGRLKKEHAEKMIKQVEIKLVETALDFFILTARELLLQNKFRQTHNAYQRALDAIENSPFTAQFKQESMRIRAEMNKVTDEWRSRRDAQSRASGEKLANQMEDMVEEQESWKKKQTYD